MGKYLTPLVIIDVQAAEEWLAAAFTPPHTAGVDIFAIASTLGAGKFSARPASVCMHHSGSFTSVGLLYFDHITSSTPPPLLFDFSKIP